MLYTTLLTHLENEILTIIINRPDKLNALNSTVLTELNHVIDEVQTNTNIKSAIVTASGNKAFVAGADIAEFSNLTEETATALAQKGQSIFFKIENSGKPIIACVNGFALGGGCELAMACHFRIASTNAKFGQPEVNLGLMPGYGGTQRLTQLIGKGRAIELLISAQIIDANTALQYGLVNKVVLPEELISTATTILNLINSKAPKAIAHCITAVNAATHNPQNGYLLEADFFGKCMATQDSKEGITAFLEKRKPIFKGE